MDCTLNFVQFANCSLLESIVVANKTRLIKNRLDVYDSDSDFSFVIETIVFRLKLSLNSLFCYTFTFD